MTSLHRAPRSRSVARRAGLGLLAGALVASGIAGMAVLNPAQASDYTNVITIATSNGGDSIITYYDDGGFVAEGEITNLTSNKCEADDDRSILSLEGELRKGSSFVGQPLGQRAGSLGVADKSNGESCAQTSSGGSTGPAERLTISLDGSVLTPGTFASRAVLDLELQKDAIIVADLYLEGTKVRSVQVNSGGNLNAGPLPGVSGTPKQCTIASSSGPNSGASDNCRWTISGAFFDKVVLTAEKGLFSLEGGADGTVETATDEYVEGMPPLASYFKLGELCNDVNTSATIATTGGEGSPTGSVKRYQDADGNNVDGSVCYNDELTASAVDENTVDIIKIGQPYAQYIVKIAWEKEPTTASALSEAISKTTIQFDIGNGGLSTETTLPWCPTSLFDGGTSVEANGADDSDGRVLKTVADSSAPSGIDDELAALNVTDMDGVSTNSVQFACIQDRDVDYTAGKFKVNDVIYVIGDLRMRG